MGIIGAGQCVDRLWFYVTEPSCVPLSRPLCVPFPLFNLDNLLACWLVVYYDLSLQLVRKTISVLSTSRAW